jgi:hypothetical protein
MVMALERWDATSAWSFLVLVSYSQLHCIVHQLGESDS